MKKFRSVLLVCVLLLILCSALIGCTDKTVTIQSYYAEDLTFKSGNTFSDSAIKVYAVMSDKTEMVVPVSSADVTKIVYSDELKALLDSDNKFIEVGEQKIVYLTVAFLDEVNADGYTVQVKITVNPKG